MKVEEVINGYNNNTALKLYIQEGAARLAELGYKRFTAGMAMMLREWFKIGKGLEDSVNDVKDCTNISDCTSKDTSLFSGNVRHMIYETVEIKIAPVDDSPTVSTEESEQPVNPGAALFDAYATAKQNLMEKLKTVLQILVACNALEVEQGDTNYIASYIRKNIKDIASHQWRYCAGHEKIYCQHTYHSKYSHSFISATIKVPVKYLGMSDDEIWAENAANAIKALEEQKASYEKQRSEMLKPIDEKINEVYTQIAMLKAHKIGD